MCFPVIFTKQNPWILYTARKLEDIGQHIPRRLSWPSWKVLKLECTRCYFLSCRKSLIYLKQKMFWYFLIFCHHSHTSLLDNAKRISFFYSFFVSAQCGAEYSGWFTLFKGETFFAATLLQVFAALKSAVLSWPIRLHCVCFAYFTDTITERKSY